MRRLMHVLIVALLCGSLGVDSAKACWLLRHRRPQTCRPTRCEPVVDPCCQVVGGTPLEVVVTGCHEGEPVAVTPLHSETVHEHHAADAAAAPEGTIGIAPAADPAPVVHGPTTVVGTPTPSPDPVSVVTTPTAPPGPEPLAQAAPPKASPMPIETAATEPAAPQDEPLPRLKPALTPDVAPASAEQPAAESPTLPAAPTPAPVDRLAAAPEVAPVAPTPTPREPNLFDLYEDDEDDATAPAADGDEAEIMEPGAAEDSEEMDTVDPAVDGSDDDTPAADDSSPDQTAPAKPRSKTAAKPRVADTDGEPGDEAGETSGDEPGDEPDGDMQETENDAAAAEDDDSEEEMKEEDSETEDSDQDGADPEEKASAAPEAEPADEPAAEESAAVSVPGEPLRRWTAAAGGREARGWLVALSPDSDGRRVRILKLNGRHATVPVETLSEADQAYVSDVASRLATASPGTGDTAGL